jgi:tetratricopeptide (TPR) repeat protein
MFMAWRKKPNGSDQPVVKKFLEDIRSYLATLIDRAGQFIDRNRVASAAAGLVLISLLGGVIASTWLAHRAKPLAKHPSNEGRLLTQFRLVNYYNGLDDLAGATRMGESRMKNALTSDVRQDVADVNNGAESAMEGYRNAALRTTAPIYDELAADNPKDRTSPRTLPLGYPNPGGGIIFLTDVDPARLNPSYGDYLALIKKQPQAALVAFQNQLVIDEKSVAVDPGNVQAQTDLAYSSSRIADLLTELGDQAGALPYYQLAVDTYTNTNAKNAATDSQDPATSLQLSRVLGKLAKTHARLGYTDKAIAEGKKATDILEALPVDAANAGQQHLRASAYAEIGDAYSLLARDTRTPQESMKQLWRAARDMYERSLEILRDLRDQGVLNPEGLTEIDTISQKIAECDLFLAK